ncbi:FMN-binding protein [Streptomyces sp. NPDC051940]|uniref:FMN-binding protein n=1 Tax=Streptomyces sp. NPDC051940 TaxID=3155675 RepID=UPI0034146F21
MRKSPVRRILLSVVGTVSTVVLMLALKPHTHPEDHAAAVQPPPSTGAAASASPSASSAEASASPEKSAEKSASKKPAATSGGSAQPSATADEPATAAPSSKPPAPQTRTVTGSAVSTKYGTVQVKITLSGDRITAAAAVKSPSSTPRSQELSAEAIPQLNSAAVSAQSADISTVSGATYTSEGYRTSLQSAIDQAGI